MVTQTHTHRHTHTHDCTHTHAHIYKYTHTNILYTYTLTHTQGQPITLSVLQICSIPATSIYKAKHKILFIYCNLTDSGKLPRLLKQKTHFTHNQQQKIESLGI